MAMRKLIAKKGTEEIEGAVRSNNKEEQVETVFILLRQTKSLFPLWSYQRLAALHDLPNAKQQILLVI